LSRQLLAIRPDLPICMLTGNASESDREKAESFGIREFLTKPLDIESMLRVVSDLMKK